MHCSVYAMAPCLVCLSEAGVISKVNLAGFQSRLPLAYPHCLVKAFGYPKIRLLLSGIWIHSLNLADFFLLFRYCVLTMTSVVNLVRWMHVCHYCCFSSHSSLLCGLGQLQQKRIFVNRSCMVTHCLLQMLLF